MKNIAFTIILFLLTLSQLFAKDFLYILDDKCIIELFNLAQNHFKSSDINIYKDSRGIVLRLNFDYENNFPLNKTKSIKKIEDFLAKINNPAIIEVHIDNFPEIYQTKLKKWEISTILANKIERTITEPYGTVEQERINSIGYGEFLPPKNTSNNGGKSLNRVDIIVLCNISGE